MSYETDIFLEYCDISQAVASFLNQSEFKEKELNVLMVDPIMTLNDKKYYRFSNYKW